MKTTIQVVLILFCAWLIASIGIRIFGAMLGLRNSEMSITVVSTLAAIAVAVWVWSRPRTGRSGARRGEQENDL